ncbi:helix-turn-helix domain-containing protein, partial [Streptomyces sp. SID14436]
LVAPADAPAVLDAARAAAGSDGTARVLLGTETELTELHRSMPVLRRTLTALPAGTVRDLGADGARSPGAAPSLEPLLSYRRADLVPAVAAYLRHRGQWERAAADLGVHRNTLRYRIATATRLLGADLDDPDVASHLWLALRTGGLA